MTADQLTGLPAAFDRLLDAVERDDIEGGVAEVQDVISPEFRFESVFGIGVEGRAYEGPGGLGEYLRDLTDAFHVVYANRRYDEPEDGFEFRGTLQLRGRGSDVEVNQPILIAFDTDEQGRVTTVKTTLES